MTRADEGDPTLIAARFHNLQHDSVGQRPIDLPPAGEQSVGWWEHEGDVHQAFAAVLLGDIVVELHLTGVSANSVGDDQVAEWTDQLVQRANVAEPAAAFNWAALMPDSPSPWSLVLTQSDVGDAWQPQTGLDLSSHEMDSQVQSVSATRTFAHDAPLSRTLTSLVTVYPSADQATTSGVDSAGTSIAAPHLGDQSAGFVQHDAGDGDAPRVTYTFVVRHGAVVTRTVEEGVAWSLVSPDEARQFATRADARLSVA
jgi:hypothetical protein